MTGINTPRALDGVVVVDISPMMPGHFCTMILADFGARVIKVERPAVGDWSRSGVAGAFESVNRNKEGLTLNLKDPMAQEVLLRLVARADVLVEGFRPGVVERLGADYATLITRQPNLVYCSLSGYGQYGPYRDLSGHDPNYLAIAGVLSLAGDPVGPPEGFVGAPMADLAGAWFAAISILVSLHARTRHGIGQYIDIALGDASYSLMQSRMVEYLLNGHPDKQKMLSRPGIGVFKTADGKYLTIGAVEDHLWNALCGALGLGAWCVDDRFATNLRRRDHGTEIREALAKAFLLRPRDEWLEVLHSVGVPTAPVNDLGEAADDPHARARELVQWIDHPVIGRLPQIRFPGLLSQTPATIRERPPLLGEHTDSILRELGYSDSGICELRAAGAV